MGNRIDRINWDRISNMEYDCNTGITTVTFEDKTVFDFDKLNTDEVLSLEKIGHKYFTEKSKKIKCEVKIEVKNNLDTFIDAVLWQKMNAPSQEIEFTFILNNKSITIGCIMDACFADLFEKLQKMEE